MLKFSCRITLNNLWTYCCHKVCNKIINSSLNLYCYCTCCIEHWSKEYINPTFTI